MGWYLGEESDANPTIATRKKQKGHDLQQFDRKSRSYVVLKLLVRVICERPVAMNLSCVKLQGRKSQPQTDSHSLTGSH